MFTRCVCLGGIVPEKRPRVRCPHSVNTCDTCLYLCVCASRSGEVPDVCLIEVGGTVGDMESLVFLEALRQMRATLPGNDMAFLHLSLVPVVGSVGEQKSKPTQHSVKVGTG